MEPIHQFIQELHSVLQFTLLMDESWRVVQVLNMVLCRCPPLILQFVDHKTVALLVTPLAQLVPKHIVAHSFKTYLLG